MISFMHFRTVCLHHGKEVDFHTFFSSKNLFFLYASNRYLQLANFPLVLYIIAESCSTNVRFVASLLQNK